MKKLLLFFLLLPCLLSAQRVVKDTTYTVTSRDSFGLKIQIVRERQLENGQGTIEFSERVDSAEFVRRLFRDAYDAMLPVRDAGKAILKATENRRAFQQANRALLALTGRNYFAMYRTQADTSLNGLWVLTRPGTNNPPRALEFRNGRFRECVARIRAGLGVYKVQSYVTGGINDIASFYSPDQFELRITPGAAGVFEFFFWQDEPSNDPNNARKQYADISGANGRSTWVLTRRTEIDEDSPRGQERVSQARTARKP